MALIPCHECKSEISSDAKVCPKCGAKIDHPNVPLRVILILIVVFIGIGVIQDYTPKGREKVKDRAELEECWQNATSSTPENMRTNASTCQMLYDWFIRKHGAKP